MRIPYALVVPVLLASALVAQKPSFPESMDFGPCLMTTFDGGGLCGTTEKGLVIRLGDRGAVAFDTELLRMSVAWTDGWLRLRGTAYDGSHGPFPSRRGQALAETRVGPGWYRGDDKNDPRPIPHGPLPTAWGRYGGHRLVGDDIVIDYRVGDMNVREHYGLEQHQVPVLLRTLELGPSKQPQTLVVLDGPEGVEHSGTTTIGDLRMAMLQWQPKNTGMVDYEGTTADWRVLSLGAPAQDDYLGKHDCSVTCVDGFAMAHGKSATDRSLPLLSDGKGAGNDDDTKASVWFDKHKVKNRDTDHGRYLVELDAALDVTRIHTYSWHKGGRAIQRYTVYGSDGADPTAKNLEKAGWTRIAKVDSSSLGQGDKHVVAIADQKGLGKFRHLLFDCRNGGTFFSEIDVYAGDVRAKVDSYGRTYKNLMVVAHGSKGPKLEAEDSRIVLRVPVHDQPQRIQLAIAACTTRGVTTKTDNDKIANLMTGLIKERDVAAIPTGPSSKRWGEAITTEGIIGADDGPFAVDTITIPFDNPYGSRMRTGAFDFFSDGRAAVSTWNGDVWIVSGIDADLGRLEWRRFATGLFDPLGLRIVDDVVYVHGRDGLTRLIDSNNDGEADRYECFNNQVYITAAFHEFAFDLQTDKEGNFYFTKGAPVNPGGRGFMKIVPHHGTILKVSRDGSTIETVATGMRAPNGMGVSPTGIITSGDNEGTYMPRCRLNWIEKPGFYAGVKDTAHRTPVPDQPDLPLCWMPMEVDNSGGGQVWVTGSAWRDLQGRLLHYSYGTCSTYLVLSERVNGQMQGGVVRLPANYTSSCMRGRFSPIDGQMYVIGLKGWQTSAAREGGFHRVRRTSRPLDLPVALSTCDKGVYLTFSSALDAETAADPESFGVQVWNYRYSQNYGSPELSILHPERKIARGKPNRDSLKVTSSKLSADGHTVFLAIEGMQPVHQMKITWDLDSKDGRGVRGELHNSIHALQKDPGFPKAR
jgi:hypothetical protein